MRILVILAISILISISCKSKKDTITIPEEVVPREENRDNTGPRNGNRRQQRGAMDPDQIIATLELDEVQEVQFLEIWEKNKEKVKILRETSKGDRSTMRTKMKAMREENENAVKAILTPDQVKKYDEMLAKIKNKRKGRRARG